MFKKILFVDDSKTLRSFFRLTFQNHQGIEAVLARNGNRALEALEVHQDFDAVVLDLYMPGRLGLEVLHEIRQDPSWGAIPILVISGQADEASICEVLKWGANGFLAKPFSPKQLLDKLAELESHRHIPLSEDRVGSHT